MTTTTAASRGCDTEDMVVVHRVFRRMLHDGPDLVADVRSGDDERRRAVVDHLLQVTAALHGHHAAEDRHLWDALEARAPGCAVHVRLMRHQHAAMAEALVAADAALTAWRASGSDSDAATSAAAVAAVRALLEEHLGDEERRILPAAAKAMTQREWDAIGRAARAGHPDLPDFVRPMSGWVQLGLMLDGLDAQQLREVRRILPAPVIVLYGLIGRRRFAAYRERVWGTAARPSPQP